jgi:hypothetical protein
MPVDAVTRQNQECRMRTCLKTHISCVLYCAKKYTKVSCWGTRALPLNRLSPADHGSGGFVLCFSSSVRLSAISGVGGGGCFSRIVLTRYTKPVFKYQPCLVDSITYQLALLCLPYQSTNTTLRHNLKAGA